MWPAIIGAVGAIAGGAMGNEQSRASSVRQMDWQNWMSSTAHQREVLDLRAAGLNPILSATRGGAGASTPSGSSYQARDVISPAITSALQMYNASVQRDLIKAQAEREQASALKTLAEARMVPLQESLLQGQSFSAFSQGRLNNELMINQEFVRDLLKSQKLSEDSKAKLNSGNLEIVTEELKSLKNQGKISETEYGRVLAFIKRGVDTIGPLLPWFRPSTWSGRN